MKRTARFMSCEDFGDRELRLAAVHDREDRVAAVEQTRSTEARLMRSWAENQPPLTTQMTPAPLALSLGVKTSIVRAVPYLRP